MDSIDYSVFDRLCQWQEEDQPLWLVTVAQTFGSSPRPPGSMLALRADGLAVGSVSGGCIEDDLAARARDGRLPACGSEILSYGLTRDEALRFGLPCGGAIRLVVEPANKAAWVARVLQAMREGQIVKRTLHLASSRMLLSQGGRGDVVSFDGETLVSLYGPRLRLVIIGAGATSSCLARMAQALDYQVIVCDPREAMRDTWDVPGAVLVADMPDDALLSLAIDSCTAIVALTHDPRLDDMALLEALKSPAFYVGALGSRATNARRRERLRLFDLADGEIDRLHGPVGLPIGSRTPPEIAVSILAHLISVRNCKAAQAALPILEEVCT